VTPARVAILGGGPAALAAAFELTDPANPQRAEVTIYQPGWRLGGKCASGRNHARGGRIEEHGLHVWFGFYRNAWDLLGRCYADPCRRKHVGFAGIDDAFLSVRHVQLGQPRGKRWADITLPFKLGSGRPPVPAPGPPPSQSPRRSPRASHCSRSA